MKLHLCDYCKLRIPEDSKLFVNIIITDHDPNDSDTKFTYSPDRMTPVQIEACQSCATERGILVQGPAAKLALVPNVGRLTEEEFERLSKEQP